MRGVISDPPGLRGRLQHCNPAPAQTILMRYPMLSRHFLKFGSSMLALLVLVACGGGSAYGGGGGGGGGNGIITNIVISPGSSSIMPGKTQQFMATTKDSSGNMIN